MGFNTVGMEEAYTKTYQAGEQSFYEGIGYSFLYSLNDYTADPYSHYQWTEDDNKYFYPTSHRFSITKRFNSYDPDGRAATENVQVIEYTLYNYDEYGNLFSKSKKFEFPDEAGASNFITNNEAIFHIHDDEIVEHDPIGSSGKFIFDFRKVYISVCSARNTWKEMRIMTTDSIPRPEWAFIISFLIETKNARQR